jgi:putative oxidoreductase
VFIKRYIPISYCFAPAGHAYFVSTNTKAMRHLSRSLPAALLILLYFYAALSKLLDFSLFHAQLYRQPFPHDVADLLHYGLPGVELLTVLLLMIPRTISTGLQLSLVLLLLFTGYIALALLHFWSHVPCSCGGVLSRLSWRSHFVFNCFFLCLNFIAIHIHLEERRPAA